MQILLVFALVIAFLAILFATNNNEIISISYIFGKTEGSLALILFITLFAGALISYLATTPSQIKRRMTISSQRKQITELESQLSSTQDELAQIQEKHAQIEAAKQAEEMTPANGEGAPAAEEEK